MDGDLRREGRGDKVWLATNTSLLLATILQVVITTITIVFLVRVELIENLKNLVNVLMLKKTGRG